MSKKFEHILNIGGLLTDRPADKIPDRNLSDVFCIDFSSFGLAQTLRGPRIFGDKLTEVGSITRAYMYRKNYGTLKKIYLRVRDNGTTSVLQWFNASNPDNSDGKWEDLVTGLTTGAIMGFTPFNQTNLNQLIFCNAINNYSSWNGATATVASVTANTIVCSETLASEGFTGTGSLMIDGTEYAYAGITSKTFTGVTPNPTSQAPAVGSGVAQLPDTTTYSSNPKGNVLLTASARVWLSGVPTRESTVYYSKVGDATTFTAGTTPDDGGIEDFPDGGGSINLLDQKDNRKIIIHKDDAVLQFQLDYTATAKIPYLDVLAIAPGVGAVNQKAGTGNGRTSYFVGGVEGLKSLARAISGDNIDVGDSLYEGILATIDNYDFSCASAVFYQPKRLILVACKSESSKNYNDTVISLYIKRNTEGSFISDISIDYGFVNDWIVDGNELYAFSSIDQNCYKYFERNSYNGLGLRHKMVTGEFTFGSPSQLKEFDTIYVEGLIGSHTKIKVSVMYGIMGSTDIRPRILEWDNENYVSGQKISALGTDIIGLNSLGAKNENIRNSYIFSVPIHVDVLASTRYKIKIETEYDNETVDEAYWAISNIGHNPSLKGIEQNKIINTN